MLSEKKPRGLWEKSYVRPISVPQSVKWQIHKAIFALQSQNNPALYAYVKEFQCLSLISWRSVSE
jgi:hypothetical protein